MTEKLIKIFFHSPKEILRFMLKLLILETHLKLLFVLMIINLDYLSLLKTKMAISYDVFYLMNLNKFRVSLLIFNYLEPKKIKLNKSAMLSLHHSSHKS